jgi:hypothetical protein
MRRSMPYPILIVIQIQGLSAAPPIRLSPSCSLAADNSLVAGLR